MEKLLSGSSHWLWQIRWHCESKVFNSPPVVLPQTGAREVPLQGQAQLLLRGSCGGVAAVADTSR